MYVSLQLKMLKRMYVHSSTMLFVRAYSVSSESERTQMKERQSCAKEIKIWQNKYWRLFRWMYGCMRKPERTCVYTVYCVLAHSVFWLLFFSSISLSMCASVYLCNFERICICHLWISMNWNTNRVGKCLVNVLFVLFANIQFKLLYLV